MAKRGIKITREIYLKGVRKVGLDSGMLISLVDNKYLFARYILKVDKERGLLLTHEICVKEAIEVLSRDYGYDKEKAKGEIKKFLEERGIQILSIDRSNFNTVRWMSKRCKESNIEFHPPDSFVIADFYKNGINKVYSNNNHFLDACSLFGMDTSKLRVEESEIERQLKEIFKRSKRK